MAVTVPRAPVPGFSHGWLAFFSGRAQQFARSRLGEIEVVVGRGRHAGRARLGRRCRANRGGLLGLFGIPAEE